MIPLTSPMLSCPTLQHRRWWPLLGRPAEAQPQGRRHRTASTLMRLLGASLPASLLSACGAPWHPAESAAQPRCRHTKASPTSAEGPTQDAWKATAADSAEDGAGAT